MPPKAATKSKQLSVRLTPETMYQIAHLAKGWSPVVPLSVADVVTEAVRRAYQAEAKPRKKS